MGEFFFFNGENLNQLANDGKSQKIKEAIYNVLGLELLETAIEKAQAARKSLNKEFNSHADTDTQKMLDQLAKLDEEMDDLKEETKQLLENRDALEAENLNIENKLEATRESRTAQEKRKNLKSHLETTDQSLFRQEATLIKFISEKSYYLFSSKLIEKGEEIVKRLEDEGKIPAKFTTSVLEKLFGYGEVYLRCGPFRGYFSP
jgi:chromosome segregation ATPase